MSQDTKIKQAFDAVRKDISAISQTTKDLIQKQNTQENAVKIHKETTIEKIDSASMSLRKEVDKSLNHVEEIIAAISSKIDRTKNDLKKTIQSNNQQTQTLFKDINSDINSIEKDIVKLLENQQKLQQKEKENSQLVSENTASVKKTITQIKKQERAMEKVIELKKGLSTKISQISDLHEELPRVKKELQEAIVILDDKLDEHLEKQEKVFTRETKELSEKVFRNLTEISEIRDATSTVQKQIKETANEQQANFLTHIETKNTEIEMLKKENVELKQSVTEIEKKLEQIENKVIERMQKNFEKKIEKINKKVEDKPKKKATKKSKGGAKGFLYNLFFEEVDAPEPSKKKGIENKSQEKSKAKS